MKKLMIIGGLITALLAGANASSMSELHSIKKCKLKVKHGTLRQRGFCPKWTVDNANSNLNY